ncbi:SPOR domain-containing protein [Hyphobacterium sp.]|jgi:cell division protein FtsN|uniref:SPOR domain-containing protein n=1 Tax=Hyphobacterium sp. TaxID=2004662 RepID=UPI003BAB3B18
MSDRDRDYPDDDYEDDETFDAREDSRRGPLLLTTAFAVFVLFVAVVWSAYQQGARDRDEPPRIVADSEPFRERPADPGGAETPDLDIEAYERISGESDAEDGATPRDGPEEPVTDGSRPALRLEETTPDEAAQSEAGLSDGAAVFTETPQDQPAEDSPATNPPPPPPPQPAETTRTASLAIPAPVDEGGWVVQIGSFRTEEEAESAWVNFITGYSDIAAGASPDIQAAEIDGRGTYHRLRIAAFAGRDEASAFCAALQDRGQDCFATRR